MKNDLLANRHIGISEKDEDRCSKKSEWQAWTS